METQAQYAQKGDGVLMVHGEALSADRARGAPSRKINEAIVVFQVHLAEPRCDAATLGRDRTTVYYWPIVVVHCTMLHCLALR